MNEGVKIICDMLLEKPYLFAQAYTGDWTEKRWLKLAEYVTENDDNVFTEEEVQAVQAAKQEARRKEFTATVIAHRTWETDPANKGSYSTPPTPKTKREMAEDEEQHRQWEEERQKRQAYEYTARQAVAGPSGTLGAGGMGSALNSILGGA